MNHDRRSPRLHVSAALALLAASGSVFAHPGHDGASLIVGLAHPFAGLDHLLAMVAVGLFAARQNGLGRAFVPVTFVLAMLAGAALSGLGIALPGVEAGIAASVLALGLFVTFLARLPLVAALPLVASFAMFHGHVHHAEFAGEAVAAHLMGVAAATALLHAAGYAAARRVPDTVFGRIVTRTIGALIAGTGALLLGA